mmetsp:Transcript_10639/g.25450  ORF Transcript_10639/g.25450 Transcript_10639/m.25450 type:complete len:122 (+) Transcript_10639:338-703(+)
MAHRQVTMQRIVIERQMAMNIARARDMVKWYGGFYSVAFVGLVSRASATKNKAWAMPLVPLSFVLAYQLDMAYYTKLDRVRAEAEHILHNQYQLVQLPAGPLKPAHVEAVMAGKKGLHDRD